MAKIVAVAKDLARMASKAPAVEIDYSAAGQVHSARQADNHYPMGQAFETDTKLTRGQFTNSPQIRGVINARLRLNWRLSSAFCVRFPTQNHHVPTATFKRGALLLNRSPRTATEQILGEQFAEIDTSLGSETVSLREQRAPTRITG